MLCTYGAVGIFNKYRVKHSLYIGFLLPLFFWGRHGCRCYHCFSCSLRSKLQG